MDHILDLILFITDDDCVSIPNKFFMCDFDRSYLRPNSKEECNQSGKVLFIPAENEFLVLCFCVNGENSTF